MIRIFKTAFLALMLLLITTNIYGQDAEPIARFELGILGEIYDIEFSINGSRLAVGSTKGIWFFDTDILPLKPAFLIKDIPDRSTIKFCSIAISPDGRLLANAQPSSINLWDIERAEHITTIEGGAYPVAFSPDGRLLASIPRSETGGEIALWDLTALGNVTTLGPDYGSLRSIDFSPDGKLIASGTYNGAVKLWDIERAECIATVGGHGESVDSIAFSPDGKTLISGTWRSVRFWNVENLEYITTLESGNYPFALSPDGTLLAAEDFWLRRKDPIRIWDMEILENITTLEGHQANIEFEKDMSFSPDSKMLASGSHREVKLWDVESGECISTIGGSIPNAIAFSSDNKLVVSGFWDDTIKLLDPKNPDDIALLGRHTDDINSVAISPDGSLLASTSESLWFSTKIRLWDLENRVCLGDMWCPFTVYSIAFSPNSQLLAVGSDNATMLYEAKTGRFIATLEGHQGAVYSVIFSQDGKLLGSVSENEQDISEIKIWDIENAECMSTLSGYMDEVTSIAFSPDGRLLASVASVAYDNVVKLWSIGCEKSIATFEGHTKRIASIVFSPDGTLLLSGSWDKTIKLWGVASRECVATLNNERAIISLVFSQDGTLLSSASSSDTILVWDVASFPSAPLVNHLPVADFAWSPEEPTVNEEITFDASGLSHDFDGQIVLYKWDFGDSGIAEGVIAKHSYSIEGEYEVTLEVIDNDGGFAGISAQITVEQPEDTPDNKPPVVNFYYRPLSFIVGRSQIFDASSSYDPDGEIISYEWNFGDGVMANDVKVTHAYASAGTYQLKLTVTDNQKAKGYYEERIVIKTLPEESVATLEGHRDYVYSIAFSSDGQLLASTSNDATKLWDVNRRERIASGLNGNDVVFAPNAKLLAMARSDKILLFSYLKDMNPLDAICFEGHEDDVRSVAFSPDGTLLASGSDDRTIKLWNVDTAECIATLEGYEDVVFSPNGELIASSGPWSDTIKLWDTTSYEPIATLQGGGPIAFSPDGKFMASGSGLWKDGAIRLWDIDNTECVTTLEGHIEYVTTLAFSPDNTLLISGASDGTILLWATPSFPMNQPPVASFSFWPENPVVNEEIVFDASAWQDIDGEIIAWEWYFGDGTTASDRIEVYAYPLAGEYKVTLTIIDDKKAEVTVSRKVIVTVPEEEAAMAPARNAALQNYPNPFNPETWMPYQLARESMVVIRIFSASGRLVRTLDIGYRPAGVYAERNKAAYWDGLSDTGEQAASGVYFYCLQAGDFAETKKMIVSR